MKPLLYINYQKIEKVDLTGNMMLDFVLTAYNYAKLTFKKYSSQYSKQKIHTTPIICNFSIQNIQQIRL